jgi:probable HAF family extracellular repeat protein
MTRTARSRIAPALALGVLVLYSACSPSDLSGPPDSGPASVASSNPTVTSTNPTDGKQGMTLDVQVSGSGFDNGSKVDFLLNGQATPKVRTNSTRFVASTQLVANITIAIDAITDLYDVAVTTSRGRKGIGTELFTVSAVTDLGTFGGATSLARGVNSQGQVTGVSDLPDGSYHTFIWTAASGMVDLGTVPGDNSSNGFAINDNGEVFGESHPPGAPGAGSPAIWMPNGSGGYTVASLNMSTLAISTDLNDAGMVVGDYPDAAGSDQPYAWTPTGGRVTLPLLPGFYRGRATAISNPGTIVGWEVYQSSSGRHVVGGVNTDVTEPVVWPASGGVTQLPIPSGYTNGQALGVNDLDVVVGVTWYTSNSGSPTNLAVRWRPDPAHPGAWLAPDQIRDTNGGSGKAYDVNNAGLIIGDIGGAFVWSESAGFQHLRVLNAKDGSRALKINDPTDGSPPVIVGQSGSHAVEWRLP